MSQRPYCKKAELCVCARVRVWQNRQANQGDQDEAWDGLSKVKVGLVYIKQRGEDGQITSNFRFV